METIFSCDTIMSTCNKVCCIR